MSVLLNVYLKAAVPVGGVFGDVTLGEDKAVVGEALVTGRDVVKVDHDVVGHRLYCGELGTVVICN